MFYRQLLFLILSINIFFLDNGYARSEAELFEIAQSETAKPENSTIQNQNPVPPRPSPPERIPPNKVKPGGGLSAFRRSCNNDTESLIALIPIASPVLTISSNPTFLFYIPDIPTDIDFAELSILTADEKTRVYLNRLTLPKSPGIMIVELPQDSSPLLEESALYHWYFQLYCTNTTAALEVNGWVKRVEATTARKLQVEQGEPRIWHDAIAKVAGELLITPEDEILKQQWLKLLQVIQREELINMPLWKLELEQSTTKS
ncbi:protein of unknown function (DUF928) [Xenococcus sp. PCC 7305]|uniref:DUF928 domain-containing protein n=1 Tax=Xenococcus sp. PCC 7305 TaxID=102125 RepID=UPI0002AC76C3|nr:DUF928 domain-containing protein [Xenococcus sp. PCC 7305]ELS00584.1 protein of unknown function (DUF928) [Xenococcus sp. PCC 7305]